MADIATNVNKNGRDEEAYSFSKAGKVWLEDRKKEISGASADRYEYLLGKYLIPMFGEEDVLSLSPAKINRSVAELGNAEVQGENAISAKTMSMLRSLTNSVVDYVRNGGSTNLRQEGLPRTEKNPSKPLSEDEIRKVVSCAKYHRSAEMLGMLFALYAGVGTGELCALSWDDINVEKREISIRNTLYRIRDNDPDSPDGRKVTKVSIMGVRKNAIRTVQYPSELSEYVGAVYRPGTVFLTGEKDRYMEQRTLLDHVEDFLKVYGLERLEVRRLTKTYKEGLADDWYLKEAFSGHPGEASRVAGDAALSKEVSAEVAEDVRKHVEEPVDEKSLMKEMEKDLEALRILLGKSVYEMGQFIGLSEADYLALEAGEASMDWSCFLSLLFIFRYNPRTQGVVEALGLYPESLRERIALGT